MVKFSEYLGFPTKGHEWEILSLLRRLTVKQNQMRPKGSRSFLDVSGSLRS